MPITPKIIDIVKDIRKSKVIRYTMMNVGIPIIDHIRAINKKTAKNELITNHEKSRKNFIF